jgi:hypothetical protein
LLPAAEQCVELGFDPGPVIANYIDPQPEGGCTPVGEDISGAPSWTQTLRLCAGASATLGCGDGEVCIPQTPAPFGSVCIIREGEHSCPAEYPEARSGFGDFGDERGCDCQCGDPLGVTCAGLVDLFDEADCSGEPLATLETGDPTCTDGQGATHTKAREPITGGGTCSPDGPGEPTGVVTPTDATTICCI